MKEANRHRESIKDNKTDVKIVKKKKKVDQNRKKISHLVFPSRLGIIFHKLKSLINGFFILAGVFFPAIYPENLMLM